MSVKYGKVYRPDPWVAYTRFVEKGLEFAICLGVITGAVYLWEKLS